MSIAIGENIKRLRKAKNITQEKLAEYLSVSAPTSKKRVDFTPPSWYTHAVGRNIIYTIPLRPRKGR
ncbi:MAG: helix-turn-helix domain-containing protein [Oscillospiraceae bacterium]|nr:helix-turn-helix domain-containing protein [Oscillospiraceae bacterium]